jgi:hypothetical protein
VASLVFLLATMINLVLWLNRDKLNCCQDENDDEADAKQRLLLDPDMPD